MLEMARAYENGIAPYHFRKSLTSDINFILDYKEAQKEILKEKDIKSEVKIRRGIPIEEIVRETQIENYDLVVIGSSMVDQGLLEMLLGNMAVKIINRVDLPVLVVGTRTLA